MRPFDLATGQPFAITRSDFDRFDEWTASADIDPQSLAAFQGRPVDGSEQMTIRDGVATIPIRGMIFRHDTPLTRFLTEIFGGSITDRLAADFGVASRNPDVRQILLHVDSPGGHAAGIGELAHMIHASAKPVVAYVGGMGCSASYYLASAASSVVVDPAAMLGSIGVIVGLPKKRATDPTQVVSSQSPDKRPDHETEAGKAKYQEIVDAMASVFIADVAKFRDVSPEAVVSEFGRGGVKIGRDAVDAGMADRVGSYEQTLDQMRRGEPIPRKTPSPNPKPAAMASVTTKEPAMSEQQNPPVAGTDGVDYKALYEASKAEASASFAREAEANAKAYVADLASDRRITPGEREKAQALLVQAAVDDRANPVAGSPSSRQDAVKAAYQARPQHNLTRETTNADEAGKSRALAQDPAAEPTAKAKELDDLGAKAARFATERNGNK